MRQAVIFSLKNNVILSKAYVQDDINESWFI